MIELKPTPDVLALAQAEAAHILGMSAESFVLVHTGRHMDEIPADDILGMYVCEISRYPLLNEAEEIELGREIQRGWAKTSAYS